MSNGETEVTATEETAETKNEEVIDIDLNDPQTEEAAVKIQVERPKNPLKILQGHNRSFIVVRQVVPDLTAIFRQHSEGTKLEQKWQQGEF